MFDFSIFNKIADEFISALVHDFSDPILQKQLIREINSLVESIPNPIMRTIASEYVNKAIDMAASKVTPFFKEVVVSDPPESVDVSASVVKDTVNKKIDSLAERIKQEIEKKKNKKG